MIKKVEHLRVPPHDAPIAEEEPLVLGSLAPLEHCLDVPYEAIDSVDPGQHGHLDAA